ncbi:MAG: phosphodiester glycosidase family protein [Bacteroidales bacterium]|nr:phosphodiester glycosidase family protein [Bacteroidales bacterium]MCI1785331.1 phosphodiester glycosidase family protein [Bacteroidales bacterium]
MKRIFLILTLAAGLSIGKTYAVNPVRTNKDSVVFVNAGWNWKRINGNGKTLKEKISAKPKYAEYGYAQIKMFGGIQSIAIIRYPSKKYNTTIINAEGKSADVVSNLGRRNGALAAINGSYFRIRDKEPDTFFKKDTVISARTVPGETFRCNGVVCIKKEDVRNKRQNGNGRMSIFLCGTTEYGTYTRYCEEVLASGPVITEKGQKKNYEKVPDYGFYHTRHPRSLVGYTAEGTVYMIVIDGRAKGNADGMTISELCDIAGFLNLEDSINLDGGGSSDLWTAQEGVISHPCDNKKFDGKGERKVPNAIMVK